MVFAGVAKAQEPPITVAISTVRGSAHQVLRRESGRWARAARWWRCWTCYARSFSTAACSFPAGRNCALPPTASAIPQTDAIRCVWQSLPPPLSTPVPTKQMPYPLTTVDKDFLHRARIKSQFYRLRPSAQTVFTILPLLLSSTMKSGAGSPSLAASAV